LTKKSHNPLSPPPKLYRFISASLFSLSQVENEVKILHFGDVAEIQETVTDEVKNVQKEEFSAAFQKMYDGAKAYIYAHMELLLNKKGMSLPHVSSI
jgi:hypothetical protein